jgi:arsenate reductase (thioredoxin)
MQESARSQMPEGFVNAQFDDRYIARSAGSEPTEVHPCAIEVMIEEGIDIASQRAKSVNEFKDVSFEYIVTRCADNQENCPIFPSGETYLQYAFPDPFYACGRREL